MKTHNLVLAMGVVTAVIGSAVSAATLGVPPIGPAPQGQPAAGKEGSLQVYSARTRQEVVNINGEVFIEGNIQPDPYNLAHSDYAITTLDGKVIKRVRNAKGMNDDRASVVTLPPGQYEVVELRLSARTPVCGPALLGCLRLPTQGLPEQFIIDVLPNPGSGHRGARSHDGAWREAFIDEGGAYIGVEPECDSSLNAIEDPVRDLDVESGILAGTIALSWTSGSGAYTMLRYRYDGKYPSDPWDGELLALLPSSIQQDTHVFHFPGEMRITAWSVDLDATGQVHTASSIECGSLATSTVHAPVGVETRGWGRVKALYR